MSRSVEKASQPPLAVVPARSSGPASWPPTPGADQQAALRLVALATVIRVVRNRRLYERLAVSAIVAAALTRIGKESGLSMIARLAAWNTQEIQRLARRAERHGRDR